MQANSENSAFAFAFLVVIPEGVLLLQLPLCLLDWNEAR
jgi:hypothetical protein